MVEKKFNFYNFFKIYYKNINESVFFYNFNIFRDFEWEFYADGISKILINYIGVFFIISSNFILYTDLFLLKTFLKKKKSPIKIKFITKRFFYKIFLGNYAFFKNNKNNFLICLKDYF